MKTNKLINCPQCGGFGFTSMPVSTDYKITVCRAKTCELCHGAGVIEGPMTNADRIRAMSDEELVNLHYSFFNGVEHTNTGLQLVSYQLSSDDFTDGNTVKLPRERKEGAE